MLLKSASPVHLELCAVKRFLPGEHHITRSYKYSVLILMQQGVLRFYEAGQPVELHAGEYYIQRAGLLQEGTDQHGEEPAQDHLCPVYLYMEFSGGEYAESGNGIPLWGKYAQGRITELAGRCAEALTEPNYDPFLMSAYLCGVLSLLYAAAPDRDPNEDTLSVVRRYIRSSYASPLTVRALARQFNYHEDYLARLFRRRYGITPGKYLRRVRMEHALWQLENTSHTVEQIASAVGYRDVSAFYRAFEAEYGTSPGARRK